MKLTIVDLLYFFILVYGKSGICESENVPEKIRGNLTIHLGPEMHLTLILGTLYKTDLFVIFI